MATIPAFISGMGEDAVYYRRDLDLLSRDAETGWPDVAWVADGDFFCPDFDCGDFVCSCIRVMVRGVNTVVRDTPEGRVTEQRARLYTATEMGTRDRVFYNGYLWEVEDVQFKHVLLTGLGYYDCTLVSLS